MKSFKPIFVEGTTLDDTWFKLLAEVYNHGRRNRIDDGSYAKETDRLEFDFVAGSIKYPTNRPLAPRLEGLAVPPPTTDEDIEKYFANYLMNGALTDNEHYKYAIWIVGGEYKLPLCRAKAEFRDNSAWTTADLIISVPNALEWIVRHYQEKGYANNHCYIQVGYPESNLAYDIPYTDETDRQTSPCLRGIDIKIVEEGEKKYLLMNVYFRSWDLWGGWPENMGGLTRLMETICEMLGDVEPGALSFASKGLHCYWFQLDAVACRLNIERENVK
jgi:thymidylate synthase